MYSMAKSKDGIEYANDSTESTGRLLKLRLPVLVLGLLGGIAVSAYVSRFERVLSENVALAFFLPLMVYITGAISTQTETIYIRNVRKRQGEKIFWEYFIKEISLGAVVGLIFGAITAAATYFWLKSTDVSLVIGLSMFLSLTVAPVVALTTSNVMYKIHEDPAVGAGPFATLIGDAVTLTIYFVVATAILI